MRTGIGTTVSQVGKSLKSALCLGMPLRFPERALRSKALAPPRQRSTPETLGQAGPALQELTPAQRAQRVSKAAAKGRAR